MKKIIILVSLLFTSFTSNAQIVLNEIYVRPDGAVPTPPNGIIYSGSKEYIELYNKGCTTINVSGYFLATKQQGSGVTGLTIRIPNVPAAIIPPGGHIVLGSADPGDGLVGNIDIPLSSSDWCLYANNAVISNVESWLALYNNLGVALDCVYWSNAPGNITASPNYFNPGTLCLPTGSPAVTLQTPTQINASNPSIISYIANSTPILIYRQQDGSSTWSFVSTYDAATLPWTMGNCNGGNCLPNATITGISYASPFYTFETSPQPVTLTGTGSYTGGTYSSTTGLSINASTGAITPSASNAGTYTVTYTKTLSGVCIVTASTQVTIFGPSTPVSVTVPPYINCDSNNGFSVFDLTINNSIILAGQPAGSSNYFITYHETLTNANNGTNALVPENYFNIIPYNQTIYYRVVNPVTGEFAVGSIQLIVNDAPVAVVLNPIVVCDQDSNPQNAITLVNLTQQTAAVLAQQTQAASNYTVMYYTSLVSAQLGTAPILNDTNYFGSNLEMIWVRVEDVTTGCYNIGSFLLQINKPLLLTTPLPLSLCDDDASPNNLFHVFDLTYRDVLITQGLTGYTVNYYPSIVDAQNGTNVILTPTAYQNVFPAVQTLGVVVTSSAGCRSITTLDIRVLPIPTPIINTANNVTTICVDFITNQVVRPLTLNSGVTSPSNYTFQWFEGTSTTPIPGATGPSYTVNTPSPTGATRDYTVKVTSNSPSACQTTSLPFSVIQSGQAAIPIGTIGFTVTSPFSSLQTITVNIEGYGAPDYQYSLDDGPRQTSNVFENVSLGTHVIHVWDTKGNIAYSCEELIITDVQILGVSDTEIVPLQFAPNPVKTNLELQSTVVLQSVIIYNVLGQKVYEKIINDNSAILDLSNLRTGNYLVKIDAETGQKVIRIVKD